MMSTSTTLAKWKTQLLKGYLEFFVMRVLEIKESAYGGEILGEVKTLNLNITEGTLYPLLNRMQRNGWLTSRWKTPDTQGHTRRYYMLSQEGRALLPHMHKICAQLNDTVLYGEKDDEKKNDEKRV